MKIGSSNRSQLGGRNDIIYTKLLLIGGAMQVVIAFSKFCWVVTSNVEIFMATTTLTNLDRVNECLIYFKN